MQNKYSKVSVIIPTFNEEATIAEIIDKIKHVDLGPIAKEIVVVDDGSSDKTRQILKNISDISCYFHTSNQGKGGALKTGISKCTGDIILLQDADLEYNPNDYMTMLNPILNGQVEFVMGSRFIHKNIQLVSDTKDTHFSHYIGNKLIIWLTNLLYRKKYTDYEGCYKAFTKNLAAGIEIKTNGFAYDNELICKALRLGFKIAEVPISYNPRSYSDGKKISWKDGIVVLWTIVKCRFLLKKKLAQNFFLLATHNTDNPTGGPSHFSTLSKIGSIKSKIDSNELDR